MNKQLTATEEVRGFYNNLVNLNTADFNGAEHLNKSILAHLKSNPDNNGSVFDMTLEEVKDKIFTVAWEEVTDSLPDEVKFGTCRYFAAEIEGYYRMINVKDLSEDEVFYVINTKGRPDSFGIGVIATEDQWEKVSKDYIAVGPHSDTEVPYMIHPGPPSSTIAWTGTIQRNEKQEQLSHGDVLTYADVVHNLKFKLVKALDKNPTE